MPHRVSFAQNGEDVRIWHAFGPREATHEADLRYVEVGANAPRDLSLTAALYDLGWRGLLIEPDPEFAAALRLFRPRDTVCEIAAAESRGALEFYRVPGTGLGTLDEREAERAQARGFAVETVVVPTAPMDELLTEFFAGNTAANHDVHVMSIDVEGAEASVLAGMSLKEHRPWVLCVESIAPGTTIQSKNDWIDGLARNGYQEVAFDGINRWFVARERADALVEPGAGAAPGITIAEAIATPFNAIDIGAFGWQASRTARLITSRDRDAQRFAWQRELTLASREHDVPITEYERQISELRTALIKATGGRTYAVSRHLSRVLNRARGIAKRAASSRFVSGRLIRERHLRHVTAAMGELTDQAFLGEPPVDTPRWVVSAETDSEPPRPPLPPGLSVARDFSVSEITEWLTSYPWDSDAQLESRMDNHNDEVGRVRRALQTRLWLARPAEKSRVSGDRVAFDARSLQAAAFGQRGIGRFARSALQATRETAGDDRVTLIIDPGLPPLPSELAGECQLVRRIKDASPFSVLIQPSPMTHSPDPLIPLLGSEARTLAVVFDFIPLHFPTMYLKHAAARAEYLACLDALALYSNFVCISHTARSELTWALGLATDDPRVAAASVAWPRETWEDDEVDVVAPDSRDAPIVLMTGDEPRKNTFGGLAGIAAATTDEDTREVVVVGMAGQSTRVHHWSIAAAMRPGEATTAERLPEAGLHDLLRSAEVVVVPSFDEGLSLPVIEAIRAGTPVVASDIPSHRELIGSDGFLFDPADPRSIARSIRRARKVARSGAKRRRIATRQRSRLARHSHEALEAVISNFIERHDLDAEGRSPSGPSYSTQPASRPERSRIGVLTPWRPQRTGVADFSATVFSELATMAEVTVYTTSDVESDPDAPPLIMFRSVNELFADPDAVASQHDILVSVVGNSHFHIPFIAALALVDAVAIAHDTRMVEYYLSLRGPGGVCDLMLTSLDGQRELVPELAAQIDDMRLLQNAGLWEIARRSTHLITHSVTSRERIERETGVSVAVLPFANQRLPLTAQITAADRQAARERLGLAGSDEGVVHIGSFGYLDPRTKMTDVVLESAGWLTSWGHDVALHFVGAGSDEQVVSLRGRAEQLGLHSFQVTGFQSESEFRDWLLAVDLGVQLRVSPLLGVSGPLSDLAAFGTPTVASRGLCEDVDTPDYVHRLPDAVSPVIVAEAVENLLASPRDPNALETARQTYIAGKSAHLYAQELHSFLVGVIG